MYEKLWSIAGFKEKATFKTKDSRKKQSLKMKQTLSDKDQRKRLSINTKKLWQNDSFIENQLKNNRFFQGHRTSKLHLKIREQLGLDKLGFNLEQNISKYFVDELNEEKKLIIEINGDYIHANPKIYKPGDEIILPGNSYLAKEKWEYDKIRKEYLESLGYTIFIIWESDNLDVKKNELNVLLN